MNLVKNNLKNAIRERMLKAAEERKKNNGKQVIEAKSALDTVLRKSLFHKTDLKFKSELQEVAEKLENRIAYNQHYKKRDLNSSVVQGISNMIETDVDPKIKYMNKVNQNLNLFLPIFDKVVSKTLCL